MFRSVLACIGVVEVALARGCRSCWPSVRHEGAVRRARGVASISGDGAHGLVPFKKKTSWVAPTLWRLQIERTRGGGP